MFGLEKHIHKADLDKDAIAELLHTSPENLQAFEDAYNTQVLEREDPKDFFQTNSRQAAARKHENDQQGMDTALEQRIIDELLAQTTVYIFDGFLDGLPETTHALWDLPTETQPVTNEEITALQPGQRPQLAGSLMKVDMDIPSYQTLLMYYKEFVSKPGTKQAQTAYHRFRQGLDILDLDPVTYEIIGMNKNSMGYWFPALVNACRGQDFLKIPATKIAKVPMPLLQLTRVDYEDLTEATLRIVDGWAKEAFHLDETREYFIKTGTYSSKFDFRNARVHGEKEVNELGEYLLYIHFQALQMASPLSTPCIYGVSTTNEWVVRGFIPDKENNPCIYKGLPLHTEYRVFVDCDTDQVLCIVPYWEPETMKKRFGYEADADSVHNKHDYVTYKAHEETLMRRYEENKERVAAQIACILPGLDLQGQWSIDVMQNGDDFWLIDMALAESSAFYDCVPPAQRKPSQENWLPELPEV